MNSTNQLPTSDRQRKEKKTGHQFQEGPPPRQKNVEELAREAIQSSLDLRRRIEQFERAMVSEQTMTEIAKLLEQPGELERIQRQVGLRIGDLQKTDFECDEAHMDEGTMVKLHHLLNKLLQLSEKQE